MWFDLGSAYDPSGDVRYIPLCILVVGRLSSGGCGPLVLSKTGGQDETGTTEDSIDITTLAWMNTLAILVMLTLDLILTYAGLRIMRRVEQEASKTLAAAQASLDAIAKK